jgi:hypothetical protein
VIYLTLTPLVGDKIEALDMGFSGVEAEYDEVEKIL